jgi:hypothetical protein
MKILVTGGTGTVRHFQQQGLKATPEAIDRQTRLIGHAPRSFKAFASEMAAVWTGGGSPG